MKIIFNYKKNRYVKLFTILISLLPVISIYSSGIPGVNLGELLLIIFTLGAVFKRSNLNKSAPKILLLFLSYIIISTLLAMLIDSSQIINVFIRTLRFVFYIFIIYYMSNRFFDFKLAIEIIKKASIFATTYVVIQTIAYRIFGIILKGFVSFIPLYMSEYAAINYESFYKTMFYRPTSFFLEPAHFAQYIIYGLAIYLFDNDFSLKNILLGVYITFGVILSTSGQGLVVAFLVWFLFSVLLFFKKSQSSKKRILGILMPCLALVIIPFVLNTQIAKRTIARFITKGTVTAVTARSEGYVAYFMKSNLIYKIFGAGFGNTPVGFWFSGLAYILYCGGIVGISILFVFFIKYYIGSKNQLNKVFVLITIALSASAEILNSYWIVFAFSLVIYAGTVPFFVKHKVLKQGFILDTVKDGS